MKSGIINAQKSVIRLQEELLDKTTEELDSVQRTVKTAVENTVQADIQSYSAVIVPKHPPALSLLTRQRT